MLASNVTEGVRNAMPMANLEAMVTRPLSTMAVHSVANTVRNAAAQRTKTKGAALPGQQAAASASRPKVKPTVASGIKQPNGVPKVPVVAKNATGVKPTTTSKQANGTASGGEKVLKKPAALTAANLNAASGAATRKRTAASRPIGTQKYANGQVEVMFV